MSGGKIVHADLLPGETVEIRVVNDPFVYEVSIHDQNGISTWMGRISAQQMSDNQLITLEGKPLPIPAEPAYKPKLTPAQELAKRTKTKDFRPVFGLAEPVEVPMPEAPPEPELPLCKRLTVEDIARHETRTADKLLEEFKFHFEFNRSSHDPDNGKFFHTTCDTSWCAWLEFMIRRGIETDYLDKLVWRRERSPDSHFVMVPLFPTSEIYHQVLLIEDEEHPDYRFVLSDSRGYDNIAAGMVYSPQRLMLDSDFLAETSIMSETLAHHEMLGTISKHEGLLVIRDFLIDQLAAFSVYLPDDLACPSRNHRPNRFAYQKFLNERERHSKFWPNNWTLLNRKQCIFCYEANFKFLSEDMADLVPTGFNER